MTDSEFLGQTYTSANSRLKKMLLLDALVRLGEDRCYRCGKRIETVEELSIDHKKPWRKVSVDLFWDLSNIAFSHRLCNKTDRPFRGPRPPKQFVPKRVKGRPRRKGFCIDCGVRRGEIEFVEPRNVCIVCWRRRRNKQYARRVAEGYRRPEKPKKPPRRGSSRSDAKLTEEKVLCILDLGRQGMSTRKIAKMFGVSSPLIVGILRGVRWKHVL